MTENIGKDKSVIQEERIAKLFNGSRTPQSGGGKWKKGDVHSDSYLIECKTTIEPKLSYSIKKVVLDKAKHEARQMGKRTSILAFTLGEAFTDYFVVDTDFINDFKYLKEGIQNLMDRTQDQINVINAKASQLTEAQKAGGQEVSDLDKLAYQIHINRLNDFLDELRKLS
jgi:hypothetical protein